MLRLRRRFCAARGLECYNNRLFKRGDRLELRLASAAPRAVFMQPNLELRVGMEHGCEG